MISSNLEEIITLSVKANFVPRNSIGIGHDDLQNGEFKGKFLFNLIWESVKEDPRVKNDLDEKNFSKLKENFYVSS